MKVVENDRETIIKELAVEIAALPGIVKERVARMIVNGFKRLHVDTVHYSYVYQVLDQEYKSKPLSDRAKQNAKKAKDILEAQIANGYDQKADKYIDSLKDVSQADIDGDQFRGYTYKRIIAWKNDIIAQQAETIERLQRENADLRKELRKALNK